MTNFISINPRWLTVMLAVVTTLHAYSQANTLVNINDQKVILDGYDPVAYFVEGKPVPGNMLYQSTSNGAVYNFSSESNKKIFDSDPRKYEVQYGGFCAYAVSQGHVSTIDPKFCVIQRDHDGKERLICQHNQKAADLWNKNPDGLLADADKYWPAVVKNGGKQIPLKGVEHFYLNIDKTGLANQGYDVVAYHTLSKATKGDEKYTEWFHGARYQFISREHQEMFRQNPRNYLPQYGGFCAYAMSFGKVRPVNPEIFSVEDGRLMLQHTNEAYELFAKNVKGNIAKADVKWPTVEQKRAGRKIKFDKPAK
jgi:YHS domain-containing protein